MSGTVEAELQPAFAGAEDQILVIRLLYRLLALRMLGLEAQGVPGDLQLQSAHHECPCRSHRQLRAPLAPRVSGSP